ncbi:piggyBac transposable element-derived protein 4-like [Euwallacea similis]|uniref:piggyBac transposable element-derived protein 4-like n=1 Tax=Euwallacea similis TaxID=1736056 RepID=UPI0034509767
MATRAQKILNLSRQNVSSRSGSDVQIHNRQAGNQTEKFQASGLSISASRSQEKKFCYNEVVQPVIPTEYSSDYDFSDPFDSDDSTFDQTFNPAKCDDFESSSDDEKGNKIYKYTSNSDENSDIEAENEAIDNKETDEINVDITPNMHDWGHTSTGVSAFKMFTSNNFIDPSIDVTDIKPPIDMFQYVLNNDVLNSIVTETNRYAAQKLLQGYTPKSRIEFWNCTDRNEIRKFFAVLLLMGMTKVPSINLYWPKDKMFYNEFIATLIPRDRFLLLLKFIHFSNNEEAISGDRLHKTKKILSMLLKNYNSIIKPGRILTIDETMVPYRGRLHFRQYIPNKSHKYGVKLYKMCSPDGFTFNMKVYAGKGTTTTEFGHSHEIVMQLLEIIEPKEERIIFGDNFYSSIPLVESLYKQKMFYCGTLRSNRKGIPQGLNHKIKRGEVIGKEGDSIKIIKWVDKRPVMMITSDPSYDATVISTGQRNRIGFEILKPKCIIDYNKAKKGVDYSDQMSSYHSSIRKGLKWYRKVVFELILGTTVVNAWVVYNMIAQTKIGIFQFRKELAESLASRKDVVQVPLARKRIHTFIKPEGPGRKKRKPCKGCYQNLRETLTSREADKKVRRVISFCSDCPNLPGFCLECFNKHHN